MEFIKEEIKKKIKRIQIRTKKLLTGGLIGDHRTAVKGTGNEFDRIRDYNHGDDIRFVDWKSSARMDKLLVRQYFEERNRNIIIAIDISSSSFYSSGSVLKYEIISEIAGIIALVSNYNKDNVGLLLFSDHVHEFIPINKGNSHIMNIMQKLFEVKINTDLPTDISRALDFIIKKVKTKAQIFLISDFFDFKVSGNFEKNLRVVCVKHSLVAIRCHDKREEELSDIGFVNINDLETGEISFFDLSKPVNYVNPEINKFISGQNKLLKKAKVKLIDIANNKDYLPGFVQSFKKIMSC